MIRATGTGSLLLITWVVACSGTAETVAKPGGDGGGQETQGSSSGSNPGPADGSGGDDATGGGCGSSGGATSADAGAPRAQAFVSAVIGPGVLSGVNDAQACGQGDLSWQLGSPVSVAPVTFLDGSTQAGGAVHVTCVVDACGGPFQVQLAGEVDGTSGGSLVVTGAVSATGTSTGLGGTFTTQGATFVDHDCTFTLTYNDAPLPQGGQPAPGRIWGHVDCPHAQDLGQFGLGADGGSIPRTCDASADFLFENCE